MATLTDEEIFDLAMTSLSKEHEQKAAILSALPQLSYLNPDLEVRQAPLPEGILGFKKRNQPNTIYLNKNLKDKDDLVLAAAHENAHAMHDRALGGSDPETVVKRFTELAGDRGETAYNISKDLSTVGDHLAKRYGNKDWYFTPEFFKERGGYALNEQLATLAAIEDKYKIDITKDPLLSKTVFNSERRRQLYNAFSTARLTRTDSKDLRPATTIDSPQQSRTYEEQANVFENLYNYLVNKAGLR